MITHELSGGCQRKWGKPQAVPIADEHCSSMEQTVALRVSVGEPTPRQPAGILRRYSMKRNFFLAAAASSFLLAGPVFAQQQEDKNAQVKLDKQEITQLQQTLDQKGFKVGKADGIWGHKTSGALKEFQKQNNLPATGKADQQTLADLGINMQNNSNASMPQNSGRSVTTQRPRKGSNPQQQNMEPSGSSDTSPSNSSGGNGNM
jgi:hypothetical protein